jgi:4-hydroxy-tetrahydrodipicolinate reductase
MLAARQGDETGAERTTSAGSGIRVAVSGALGRMGATTCAAVAADPDLELVALVDPGLAAGPGSESAQSAAFAATGEDAPADGPRRYADLAEALDAGGIDVVVDFTTPSVVRANVLTCIERRVPAVVGTTGLSAADLSEIDQRAAAAQTPVLIAPNFAMGAVLMMEFARQAAKHFTACEIVELHHDRKLDAPSGTSRLTRLRIEEVWGEAGIDKDIPIHSVRLPGLVAHQEVIFGSLGETLTIRHDSLARESFMPGVIVAVKRIRGLQGLVVGLENVL